MDALNFIGSLIAIVALAGLARWLKLGDDPRLWTEDDAIRAASEAVDGFKPVRIGLESFGLGGLLEDAEGRILLLKPHGNFFAGRLLGPETSATEELGLLVVDCEDRYFGEVWFEMGGNDARYWEAAINALGNAADA